MALPSRLRDLVNFGFVGVASTGIYVVAVLVMVRGYGMDAIVANHAALLLAGLWSFFGHGKFSFRYRGQRRTAAWRFAVQMIVFYIVSSGVYLAAGRENARFTWSVVLVAIVTPVISYLVLKFWVYAHPLGTALPVAPDRTRDAADSGLL